MKAKREVPHTCPARSYYSLERVVACAVLFVDPVGATPLDFELGSPPALRCCCAAAALLPAACCAPACLRCLANTHPLHRSTPAAAHTAPVMMRFHRRRRRCFHDIFALLSVISCVDAWFPMSTGCGPAVVKPNNIKNLWLHVKSNVIQSAFVVSLVGGTLYLPVGPAVALGGDPVADLTAGLTGATEHQPQIKFSGNRPNQGPSPRGSQALQVLPQRGGESPILQGLIYVDRSDSRPSFADTLVITAGSADRPDDILAGAKIPVTMARFPMQFSMYQANIARGKEDLWSKAIGGDIIVTARVCPEATTLPCNDAESTYKAKGISKIIRNLPGMDEGTLVRTAISLPLK